MRNFIMAACMAVLVFAVFMGAYGAETMNLGVVLGAIATAFLAAMVALVAYVAEVRG